MQRRFLSTGRQLVCQGCGSVQGSKAWKNPSGGDIGKNV